MTIRIGVDTGGTFTDLVWLRDDALLVHKVRSTPDDPARAIVAGLAELLAVGGYADAQRVWPIGLEVVHGSTVATNAVLERRGARVAFVATEGFQDVLRIGRQTRRELYNFFVEERRPLVDPLLSVGLRERLDERGTVLEPLDEPALGDLASRLRQAGAESVAVCLLHSYANPSHERRVAEVLREAGFSVSTSSNVLNEHREFERWSTTVVNAYVAPVMEHYLARLESQLQGVRLSVMQSNGGLVSSETARRVPVHTILSGPAAGAVGALSVAQSAGVSRVIGFDMGGTSTDVTLMDGAIGLSKGAEIGDWPVGVQMMDIHTIGAGGGSVAALDVGGALRVGPRSAGADPGPACYGRGDEVTVTDANLLLGRLDPGSFLGGRLPLDVSRAESAARALASRAGLEPLAIAHGIIRVANANMERAIRVVSVQRGRDPREFALLAFGGAGGMHACDLAAALDIRTVIMPRLAGVLSALGMLYADVTRDYAHSVLASIDVADESFMRASYDRLAEAARSDLRREGVPDDRMRFDRSVALRYAGQSYEVDVPFAPSVRAAFDRGHERLYGYAMPARPVEVVALRVRAVGTTSKPVLPRVRQAGARLEPVAVRQAWFDGRRRRTPIFALEDLGAGADGRGPAILAGPCATVVVPPRFQYRVDGFGNVICRARRAERSAIVRGAFREPSSGGGHRD